jgi:hypothetical protein
MAKKRQVNRRRALQSENRYSTGVPGRMEKEGNVALSDHQKALRAPLVSA